MSEITGIIREIKAFAIRAPNFFSPKNMITKNKIFVSQTFETVGLFLFDGFPHMERAQNQIWNKTFCSEFQPRKVEFTFLYSGMP